MFLSAYSLSVIILFTILIFSFPSLILSNLNNKTNLIYFYIFLLCFNLKENNMSDNNSSITMKKSDGSPITFNFQLENGLPYKPILSPDFDFVHSDETNEYGIYITFSSKELIISKAVFWFPALKSDRAVIACMYLLRSVQ